MLFRFKTEIENILSFRQLDLVTTFRIRPDIGGSLVVINHNTGQRLSGLIFKDNTADRTLTWPCLRDGTDSVNLVLIRSRDLVVGVLDGNRIFLLIIKIPGWES